MKKLNCILLVDDDEDCNFYHKKVINKLDCAENTQFARDGVEALDILKKNVNSNGNIPELILLDINMPKVNGWDFLDLYGQLDEVQQQQITIVMLTTSINPDDKNRADNNEFVDDFLNKYLNEEALLKILESHFPTHLS